jgi:hypothetical protein
MRFPSRPTPARLGWPDSPPPGSRPGLSHPGAWLGWVGREVNGRAWGGESPGTGEVIANFAQQEGVLGGGMG